MATMCAVISIGRCLDNYEWDLGYPPKFGLYHVDRSTQKRTLRDGARAFERIVKQAQAA